MKPQDLFGPKLEAGTIVYLAGPMSGRAGFNVVLFDWYAKKLRELGLIVISPAESFGGDTTMRFSKYMEVDIAYIQAAEAIVFMPDWAESRGARLEALIGSALGRRLYVIELLDEDTIMFRYMEVNDNMINITEADCKQEVTDASS